LEANVLFSDFAIPLNGGITLGTSATGTYSGSKLALSALGATGPLRKLTYQLFASGSTSGVLTLTLQSGTASGATFSAIAGCSAAMTASATATGSLYGIQMDVRTDLFADLGLGSGAYIMPVVTIGTAATPVWLNIVGWNSGIQPARRLLSNSNFSNVVITEVDNLGLSTGAPATTIPG
jgi:hypothetical protein